MPNRWEIWLAKVKFEDDPTQIKHRPVLVLAPGECYILSLKITTHAPRGAYWGEYEIKKWEESGLRSPSTLRISKKLRLISSDFVYPIGRLHPLDILEVQRILSNGSRNR